MTRRLLAFFVFVAAALFAVEARAENVELRSSVDRAVVEVGETFAFTLQATTDGNATFDDPKPGPTPGVKIDQVSQGPVQRVMVVNGQMSQTRGLVTTWTMHADRPGTVTLGPPSVVVAGKRRAATSVAVTVVPRGQGGRRAPDPLDPWKGIFDIDDRIQREVEANVDPKLGLDAERAPVAFLHATIDKTVAVVGEQVTLTVYLYEDPYQHQGKPADVHESNAPDFLKRSLLEDETRAVGVGTAKVGGRAWNVKLVRKSALFPLKAGRLVIDPMSLTLPRARVGLRESERLSVDVSEPKVAGRPPGYQLGDVGDFALSATVNPRTLVQDGAVGVTLELRGTGNLPSKLPLPTVPGVEWLEPQINEKLGGQADERFGGTRTFAYVVRLHKPGTIDLGEVRLAFFDPSQRTYRTATAGLGIVQVTPGAPAAAGSGAKDDADLPLRALPAARTTMEGQHTGSYLTDRPGAWAAVFGAPLACVLGLGAVGLVRRSRRDRKERAPTSDEIAKKRVSEVQKALKGDDGKAAFGAVARALDALVHAKTTISLRGAAGETIARELVEKGISETQADSIIAIHRRCEDARFAPHDVPMDEARAAWEEVRTLTGELTELGER